MKLNMCVLSGGGVICPLTSKQTAKKPNLIRVNIYNYHPIVTHFIFSILVSMSLPRSIYIVST